MADITKPDFKQRSQLLIRGCLDSFAHDLGRLMLKPGVSEVHELRISIRRLQQVLDLCSETGNKKARRSLRRLMKLCGALRDCDVATAYFQGKDFRRSRTELSKRRLRAEAELAQFLSRHARELHVGGGARLQFSLRRVQTVVHQLASDFFDLGNQAIAEGFHLKDLHKARVATKRLRYTVELFTCDPTKLRPLLDLQRLLGRVNDLRNFRSSMTDWGRSSGARRRIKAETERLIVEFSETWRQEVQPYQAELISKWLGVLE